VVLELGLVVVGIGVEAHLRVLGGGANRQVVLRVDVVDDQIGEGDGIVHVHVVVGLRHQLVVVSMMYRLVIIRIILLLSLLSFLYQLFGEALIGSLDPIAVAINEGEGKLEV